LTNHRVSVYFSQSQRNNVARRAMAGAVPVRREKRMKIKAIWHGPRAVLSVLGVLGLAVFANAVCGQAPSYNELEAKGKINIEDKDGIWVLNFKFKAPRLIPVDIPGRGRRLVWYMWYQVINNTKEPRTFVPDFELVTLDRNTVHHDQILPKAQEAIKKLE